LNRRRLLFDNILRIYFPAGCEQGNAETCYNEKKAS
jgi:hypothetical protein